MSGPISGPKSGDIQRFLGSLSLATALAVGCGGEGGGTGPTPATFASVAVTPSNATLAAAAPGNSVTLTAQARDSKGQSISGASAATFLSSNVAVATVASSGLVTAVSAGTVQISASIAVAGATKSGQATIVVEPPIVPVFQAVDLSPTSAILFTIAPENSGTLVAQAKDQNGNTMSNGGSATFSSSNLAVATVDQTGLVTAVSAGSVDIMAMMTVDGLTKTGSAGVVVKVAGPSATVVAPELQFLPLLVDVEVGGSVTWTIAAVSHNTFFDGAMGAPVGFFATQDSSVTLTFPTSGIFGYRCSIHPGMNGIVRVH